MNCKEIENILPLYPDDLLSAAEKRAVEEHLQTCPKCCKELTYLQQTANMARELKDVEPPPWFKQKIMTKVREAAEQKSFMHKWFYPLRIKIPVQIFATIVLTVLAVYIYRAGEHEMKAVLPDAAPVMEAQKEAASPPIETQKEKEGGFSSQRIKKKVGPKGSGSSAEKAAMYDMSPGMPAHSPGLPAASSLKEEEKKSVDNMAAAENYAAVAAKKDAAIERDRESSGAMLSAKQEAPAKTTLAPAMEQKRGTEDMGAVRKSKLYKAAAPAPQAMTAASHQRQTVISVYVRDINVAAADLEKILGNYEAYNVAKQISAGKTTITVELKAQNIKVFMEQLKTIGQVEEKGMPIDGSRVDIPITIEIMRDKN